MKISERPEFKSKKPPVTFNENEKVIIAVKAMTKENFGSVVIVDKQNKHDFDYIPMSKDLNKSIAFQTAVELVLMGKEQPSGYTEPLLHLNRLEKKASQN